VLRPEVLEIFAKVDLILHAGDVGDADVLRQLEALAPVTAVYGNADGSVLRQRLPRVAELKVDGFAFVVTHGDKYGFPSPHDLKAEFKEADVMVFGHSHRAVLHEFPDFTVAVNPGAAGPADPKRSALPPSVVIMETEPGIPPRARIVLLSAGSPPPASS
jgi:putative phosphoesterase